MSTIDRTSLDAAPYRIADASGIFSPGLVLFGELIDHNLREMLRIAGDPARLRPHCKTHKMPAVARLMLQAGISRFKCATLVEAEMLASAGARDVLIAYQLVGPNLTALVQLSDRFPRTRFTTLIDHVRPLEMLASEATRSGRTVPVMMDVDPGMGRTGVPAGPAAQHLYEMICSTPGIEAAGLHWYDGHHRQSDPYERKLAIEGAWEPLVRLRDALLLDGLPVPLIVAGGTGSFPILAEFGEPNLELSPGTTVFYDVDYYELFPDMDFLPAAGVLTRVVSTNRNGHLTLDCGHKSVSPDQPAGRRTRIPELPDAVEISHTEEHLVVATARAGDFRHGDALVALPRHVCPTIALHQQAHLIRDGKLVETWPVTARNRILPA